MGAMIEFSGGDGAVHGYLAEAAVGSGPGVIVIQEWWGLVGHIKSVADRFAAAGFTALAPDFYNGRATDEPDEAGSMMMALNIEQAGQTIVGATQFLASHASVSGRGLGVVGFCMGGQLSMYAACLTPDIKACVNFYGIHPHVQPDFERLQAPMLGFFAENDDYASPAAVASLDQRLTELGKPHEFRTFPGTHHAFFNDDRPAYDAAAADACWNRMVEFFRAELMD